MAGVCFQFLISAKMYEVCNTSLAESSAVCTIAISTQLVKLSFFCLFFFFGGFILLLDKGLS